MHSEWWTACLLSVNDRMGRIVNSIGPWRYWWHWWLSTVLCHWGTNAHWSPLSVSALGWNGPKSSEHWGLICILWTIHLLGVSCRLCDQDGSTIVRRVLVTRQYRWVLVTRCHWWLFILSNRLMQRGWLTDEVNSFNPSVAMIGPDHSRDGLVWLLLYAHRHWSILGAAGHIILTPANQLMVMGLKIWSMSNPGSNQRPSITGLRADQLL
jgi:hypothetical protein